jgi:hypothetical protein
MRSPGFEHEFEVGDTVEVFCDHEIERERVRGWLKGIIVQVDNKMVAVQFRTDVFLTDGWMVPDRILWFPTNSDLMRQSKPLRPAPPEKPKRAPKKAVVKKAPVKKSAPKAKTAKPKAKPKAKPAAPKKKPVKRKGK